MNRFSRLAPVLLLAGISTVAACRSQPEPEPTPMPTINQDSIDSVNAARAREAAERQRVADSIAAANAARERARADSIAAENRRMEALRATIAQPIYFDFDRSEITMQARSTLEQKVPILRANPNLRIRIAGHADERGSDEYNVALGRRRAMAAQRFLTTQGIAENRIEIVSYGEERPIAMGSNESAWSQNRRDEFEIVSGGDRLMSPMQ